MTSIKLPVAAWSVSALLLAASADATILTVNSAADAGGSCPGATCTLRQAIVTAASGDTINFAAGITTINLTSAELLIDKALTITGPGANLLTVRRSAAAGNFRVFHITSASAKAISGLTIANGNAAGGGGGGIFNDLGSTLTLTGCTISGNSDIFAGGIFNSGGTLTISNSTVSGNSASSSNDGGGIYNNGFDAPSTVNVNNSTISGNSAAFGAGIVNNGPIDSFAVPATMNLTNSTVSGNSASNSGGGVATFHLSTVNVRNTIIAKNTATSNGPDFLGALTSQGFNLIGNTSGTTITGTTTGNQLNVDPLLGPLQNNGGPTFTRALLSGSPAIERGDSSGSVTDQRGFTRPVDDPSVANASDGSDIGAYEVQGDQLPGCGHTLVTNNSDAGPGSLRASIDNTCGGETITFAASVVSPINLTSGELVISKDLTIIGPGANLLTVQRSAAIGTPAFRIFQIAAGNAAISGLTIANGNAAESNGGGIFNSSLSTLTLTGCTISGNSAGGSSGHGGGLSNLGTVTITNSTFSGNHASSTGGSLGGGIFNNSGTVSITSSTISGNTVSDAGGGIYLNSGMVNLASATISGNSATDSGGIYNDSGGTVNARNTIIAKNTAGSFPDFRGPLASQGFNLIGNNSGAIITPVQFTDQTGLAGAPIDPLLGPLQNNGGRTFTQALLAGSTAIDKGHSSGSTADQRGFARRIGLAQVSGGDGGDIGAFEYGSSGRIDVDANGHYDALTDGLLIIRYLFGLAGPSLTSGAIGALATRTVPADVVQFLDSVRPALDVDGNGHTDALTDGLLMIRYLFGLRGTSLIAGAVGSGATRSNSMQIESYIQSLIP